MLIFHICSFRFLLSFCGNEDTEPLAEMYLVRVRVRRVPGTKKRCVASRNADGMPFTSRCALRFILRFILRFLVRARSCSTVRTARRARRILGLFRCEAVHWIDPGVGAGFCCLWFRTLSLGDGICSGIKPKPPGLVRRPGSPLPLKAGGGRLRNFLGYIAFGLCPLDSTAVRGERGLLRGSVVARRSSARARAKALARRQLRQVALLAPGAGRKLPTLSSACLPSLSKSDRTPGALEGWRE